MFKADLFGNYDANLQAREKQREEWQQALITQMQEQEAKKMESKMRKKYDEEMDDQRIHRQLRELQDEFVRENLPRPQLRNSIEQQNKTSNQSPINNIDINPTPRITD